MINSLNQHADEIVTEISMSQSSNPWLIVEGSSDGIFFSTRGLHGNPTTVVALGWENVTSVISKVIEESITASVFGFIDRDYREDLGVDIDEDNIVVSDFRDLEISFFESSALQRLLVEYGSTHKLPCKGCGSVDVSMVKEKIYQAASCIGRLRYFSLKEGLHYPIKKLDYSKFIDPLTLDIDNSKLISQINSKSDTKINIEILNNAFDVELPQRLMDARNICSGHDVIELLGMALRRLWGSNNTGDVARERLESSFRIGYSDQDFEASDMYQKLQSKLRA